MKTFRDSIHLAKEKQLDRLYNPLNNDNHSSGIANSNNTLETFARPVMAQVVSEKASVHFSLENVGKVCNLVKPVNG